MIELKRRARELFLALNCPVSNIRSFLEKLISAWSKFSLKDKYRKTRISSLNSLKSLTIMA